MPLVFLLLLTGIFVSWYHERSMVAYNLIKKNVCETPDLKTTDGLLSRCGVSFPETHGSHKTRSSCYNQRCKHWRHHHVGLRPLKELPRQAHNLSWPSEWNPDSLLFLTCLGEGRSRCHCPRKCHLWQERGDGNSNCQEGSPGQGVDEQWPGLDQAAEWGREEEVKAHVGLLAA